jgi:two-component system KDP operon response regulator KdpE
VISEVAAQARILLVEDQEAVMRAIGVILEASGYLVDRAVDGASALRTAELTPPDLVLLDLGLPDMDGEDVIRALRSWLDSPILVLSARVTRGDKVSALDLGADDYVTKPFVTDELLARIRAALRRSSGRRAGLPSVSTSSGFTVDLSAGRVIAEDGSDIRLTPTEWQMLEVLVRNAGSVVGHEQLLREVWGPGFENETNYLRLYAAQLRAKLEPDPSSPRHIITARGRGYRFSQD